MAPFPRFCSLWDSSSYEAQRGEWAQWQDGLGPAGWPPSPAGGARGQQPHRFRVRHTAVRMLLARGVMRRTRGRLCEALGAE